MEFKIKYLVTTYLCIPYMYNNSFEWIKVIWFRAVLWIVWKMKNRFRTSINPFSDHNKDEQYLSSYFISLQTIFCAVSDVSCICYFSKQRSIQLQQQIIFSSVSSWRILLLSSMMSSSLSLDFIMYRYYVPSSCYFLTGSYPTRRCTTTTLYYAMTDVGYDSIYKRWLMIRK